MEKRQEIRNGVLLYSCCVLLFTGIVMLGSELGIAAWFVDFLIRPGVRILLLFSESPGMLRLFDFFPHFASRGLPILYAAVLFAPLIGYATSMKKVWLSVLIGLVLLHLILFCISL